MDPNNAAYLALRNHPETTIRPINSSGDMRSPTGDTEHSPRNMEENIFKQVSRSEVMMRGVTLPCSPSREWSGSEGSERRNTPHSKASLRPPRPRPARATEEASTTSSTATN